MKQIKIAVYGAGGRMGKCLLAGIRDHENLTLVAAIDSPDSTLLGQDAAALIGGAPLGVELICDPQLIDQSPDVVVDFSTPAATGALLPVCVERQWPLVIGTTGIKAPLIADITAAGREIPIVFAANYSVGVTLCLALLSVATRALGADYDIEILEAHHRNKVDAPSGTALAMADAIKQVRALADRFEGDRYQHPDTIGFSTIRAGTIAGEHTVIFAGEHERVEIAHRVSDRMVFAQGALQAASWLSQHGNRGVYTMHDVLQLPVNLG